MSKLARKVRRFQDQKPIASSMNQVLAEVQNLASSSQQLKSILEQAQNLVIELESCKAELDKAVENASKQKEVFYRILASLGLASLKEIERLESKFSSEICGVPEYENQIESIQSGRTDRT